MNFSNQSTIRHEKSVNLKGKERQEKRHIQEIISLAHAAIEEGICDLFKSKYLR